MVVLDEFFDGAPQVPLAEEHELVQALACRRQRKSDSF
jgi:hypothetical protein